MERTDSESLDRQLDSYGTMARRREYDKVADAGDSARSWKRFAAATGASLVGVTAADAAITHVIPNPAIRVVVPYTQPYTEIEIDLDNDAINDLQVRAELAQAAYPGYYYNARLIGLSDATMLGNGIVEQFANGQSIPAVSPSSPGTLVRSSLTVAGQLYRTAGLWNPGDTAYAGFVMGPAGSKRAGWIKIRSEPFFNGLTTRMNAIEILEWAFQTVPGVAIMAGQTVSDDPIPGDYDGNGSVGPEDYAMWKNAFNSNVTPGTGADGNSDGTVNAADYTVWRDNLNGSGSGALAANVPEPATVSLGVLALGAAGIAALRRRAS